MKFQKNGSEASYRYGRILPDGSYDALVLSALEQISRNGNEMLVICLGIRGPEGGVRIDYHVVVHLSERVEETLDALAPEYLQDWHERGECELDPELMLHRICRVRVRNEPWDGRDRPRIQTLLPKPQSQV